MKTGYIIRHAQYHGNTDPTRVWGRSHHFPLTETGQLQSILLHDWIKKELEGIDPVVFVSQAKRAQETARIALLGRVSLDQMNVCEGLNESSRGKYEGLEISKIPSELADSWRVNPFYSCLEGGESLDESGFRWLKCVSEIFESVPGGKTPLIFTHGNVMRAGLIHHLLGFPPEDVFKCNFQNTDIVTLHYGDDVFELNPTSPGSYSIAPHLEENL